MTQAGTGSKSRRRFYRVPYCVPAWGWKEHLAILRCLLGGHLVDGADSARLLNSVGLFAGVRYVFGFDSGQDAILAALKSRGIGAGEKVILPSFCCETVLRPILACHAEPVFCDIGEDLNLDPRHVLALVSGAVRAVIVPHLFGRPAPLAEIEEGLRRMGRRDDVLVIDDAAQSFGIRSRGRLLGTAGDVGVVSFGPGKTMTAAGGGLLITNSEAEAARIERIALQRNSRAHKLKRLAYWFFFRRWRRFFLPLLPRMRRIMAQTPAAGPGMLCNVDAAIASCQLRRLDHMLAVRRERGRMLEELFASFSGSGFPLRDEEFTPVKYVLQLPDNSCIGSGLTDLYARLGFEMQPLYTPLHLAAAYAEWRVPLPATERLTPRLIQVPLDPWISERMFKTLLAGIRSVLSTSGPDH